MKKSFGEASELDGFEDLNDDDKAKIIKAYEDGQVADEDIPESARKPEGEEKPKKKAGGKKAAKKDEDAEEGEEEEAEEKPKKKAAKKAAKKKDEDADGEEEVAEEKPKKARTSKKVFQLSRALQTSLADCFTCNRRLKPKSVRKLKNRRRLPNLAPR